MTRGHFCIDLALFDFDGTITTHDTFRPFLSFAGGRARMALGTALLGPMVVGYELGWIHASMLWLSPTARLRLQPRLDANGGGVSDLSSQRHGISASAAAPE